jgi:hypothetical protein
MKKQLKPPTDIVDTKQHKGVCLYSYIMGFNVLVGQGHPIRVSKFFHPIINYLKDGINILSKQYIKNFHFSRYK